MSNRTMEAVVTTGTGGYEKLELREVPIPIPRDGEVLIEVLAAGMNNTEINTRLGWYSASVSDATNEVASGAGGSSLAPIDRPDGGWNKATPFPFIQGTDCCGRIVETGSGTPASRVGERVLVRPCMRAHGFESVENVWMGSDFDGAFAQYVVVPAAEVFAVVSNWTDAELGSIPCAYGTAENLIHRAAVEENDRVLITGASGGVGSAAVQLAKRRGAHVTAVCSASKAERVQAIGADEVVFRDDPGALPDPQSVNVLVDIVGGESFSRAFDALRPGGRYVTSGAVAGPIVDLDLRTLYLRDITMYGATAWDEPVFPNLVSYIERGEIKPLVAKTFPLEEIVAAQKEFLERRHVGKFVLIPPRSVG